MKKVAAKIITISSQLLVASVFLFLLFSNETGNDDNKNLVVNNNNFNKMADKTLFLFNNLENEKEEANSSVVVELTSVDKKEEPIEEEQQQSEVKETNNEETKETVKQEEESNVTPLIRDFSDKAVLETFTGSLTGYGPDCYGCGGKTSTGYDLRENIYYEDSEYGTIRILAADKYFPFYSIIRVSNVPGIDPFIAIVLDRGGDVGWYRNFVSGEIMFDSQKGTLFDLAFTTEKDPNILGKTNNVKFEVLRSGK